MIYSRVNQYKIKIVESNEDDDCWVTSNYIPKRDFMSVLCIDDFPYTPEKDEIFEFTSYEKRSPIRVSTKYVVCSLTPERKYKSTPYRLQDIWVDKIVSIGKKSAKYPDCEVQRTTRYGRIEATCLADWYPEELSIGKSFRTCIHIKNCGNMRVERHTTTVGGGYDNRYNFITAQELDIQFNAFKQELGI